MKNIGTALLAFAFCAAASAADNHIRIPASGLHSGSNSPEGVAPVVKAPVLDAPSVLEYGAMPLTETAVVVLRVKNSGDAPLTVTGIEGPAQPYQIQPQTGAQFCKVGTVVQPGALCGIRVQFVPLQLGSHEGVMRVLTDGGSRQVRLVGQGV